MSEKNQIFVIAKLDGQGYRSLAAVYDECTVYGWSSLKTCLRLLQIFSDDQNRFSIQQELSFAAEFFKNASETDIKAMAAKDNAESAAPCPFPFITTCLVVGASHVPGTALTTNIVEVHEEPFGVKYSTEHNRYGILVLDITDLGNVRYCFVGVRDIEYHLDREVPLHTPLDGWTYLRITEDDGYDSDDYSDVDMGLRATSEGLEKFALVELSALADCWPSEDWKTAINEGDSNDGLADPRSSGMPVPSLRTLSQNKLFQELLSSDGPPDLSLLDLPMLFRGFKQDLQRYMIDNVNALSKSPAAVEILEKAFAGETSFDFTPFQGKLSADTLIALASSEAMRNVKTANLSGFDSTTDMRVAAAVLEHTEIDSLYLLARPDRMIDNVFGLPKGLPRCSQHPMVRKRLVLGSAFSQGLRQSHPRPQIASLVEPSHWNTFPVIQLLYSGPPACNTYWPNKLWLTSLSLGDAWLTPARFVTGLLNVIKDRCKYPSAAADGMKSGELGMRLAFACAPPSLKTFTTSTEISPIPAKGVACSDYIYDPSLGRFVPVPIRDRDIGDIGPDGWTAVMVHTATRDVSSMGYWDPVFEKTRYRVALVRSKHGTVPISDFRDKTCEVEVEVADLKRFLEVTDPEHADDLEAVLSELTTWAETDDDLVSKLELDETLSTLRAFAERIG